MRILSLVTLQISVLNDTCAALAHDLTTGIAKEISIMLRSVLAADVMTNLYPTLLVCRDAALHTRTRCPSLCYMCCLQEIAERPGPLSSPFAQLGFYSVPDALYTIIGRTIHATVATVLASHLTPMLSKLTVIACEPLAGHSAPTASLPGDAVDPPATTTTKE